MSYSDFAWKGFTQYVKILDILGLRKPIFCNANTHKLQVTLRRPVFTWILLNSISILNGLIIPIIVLRKPYGNSNDTDAVNFVQILVIVVHIIAVIHQFPVFISFLFTSSELTSGFNHLIEIEETIRGNQSSGKSLDKQARLDVMGLVMNFIVVGLLIVPSVAFFLILLDYDCLFHMLTREFRHSFSGKMFRFLVSFVSVVEMATTIGVYHVILMTLVVHLESIFSYLERFQNSKGALQNSRRKTFSKTSKNCSKIFDGFSDIILFKLSAYFMTVTRKNLDVTTVFAYFAGFALEVFFGSIVLSCYNEIPAFIYFFDILIWAIICIVIVTDLPQAGKGYAASQNLVGSWKSVCRSRRLHRFKEVSSCKPVGLSLGGMFMFEVSTTTTFFEAVMDYTINLILTF